MKRLWAVLLALASAVACAQDYPARPVTVIVPFSTGSASDVIARIVLERMNAEARNDGSVQCTACREESPANFDLCWNCGGSL